MGLGLGNLNCDCCVCNWFGEETAPSTLSLDALPDIVIRMWDNTNNGYWNFTIPSSCLWGNVIDFSGANTEPPSLFHHLADTADGTGSLGIVECAYLWSESIAYPGDTCGTASFDSEDGPEFDTTADYSVWGDADIYIGTLAADCDAGSRGDLVVYISLFVGFEVAFPYLTAGSVEFRGHENQGPPVSFTWTGFASDVPMKAYSPTSNLPDIATGDSWGTLHVEAP